MAEGFRSQDVGLRAQKKVLSRMANNRTLVKSVIDDTTGQLLDNLHKLAKNQTGSKKEANKFTTNVTKLIIKVEIYSKDFNQDEQKIAEDMLKKFQYIKDVAVYFYQTEGTYDHNLLQEKLSEVERLLEECMRRHVTPKSLRRIHYVFQFFSNTHFLDAIFLEKSPERDLVGETLNCLEQVTGKLGW